MKKILTLGTLILALAMSIMFTACPPDSPSGDDSVTYTSKDSDGKTYRLVISKVARAVEKGDNYVLTITLANGTIEIKNSGTVESYKGDIIGLSGNDSAQFSITITNGYMTKIEGSITENGITKQILVDIAPADGGSSVEGGSKYSYQSIPYLTGTDFTSIFNVSVPAIGEPILLSGTKADMDTKFATAAAKPNSNSQIDKDKDNYQIEILVNIMAVEGRDQVIKPSQKTEFLNRLNSTGNSAAANHFATEDGVDYILLFRIFKQ